MPTRSQYSSNQRWKEFIMSCVDPLVEWQVVSLAMKQHKNWPVVGVFPYQNLSWTTHIPTVSKSLLSIFFLKTMLSHHFLFSSLEYRYYCLMTWVSLPTPSNRGSHSWWWHVPQNFLVITLLHLPQNHTWCKIQTFALCLNMIQIKKLVTSQFSAIP